MTIRFRRTPWMIIVIALVGWGDVTDGFSRNTRTSAHNAIIITTDPRTIHTFGMADLICRRRNRIDKKMSSSPSFALWLGRLSDSPSDSAASTQLLSTHSSTEQQDQSIAHHAGRRGIEEKEDSYLCRPKNITSSPVILVPSYKTLLLFCSTTVIMWLSEPLLSLVDTTVVGVTQGDKAIVQLAALGPATTLVDSVLYAFYFLSLATTNQLSTIQASDESSHKYRQLRRSTSDILGVAAACGSLVSIFLAFASTSVLKRMVGAGSSSAEMGQLASQYCYIRGLVAPFSIMNMVAQAFCLATSDTRTPIIAVAVASIINVVGDLLIPGMQGAAFASAIASLGSSIILLRAVKRKTELWRLHEQVLPTTIAEPPLGNIADKGPVTPRTFVLSLPDRRSFGALIFLSLPLAFNMWCKVASYSALTIKATAFSLQDLAGHNVLLRLFFFIGSVADSLSAAAQTFLPATLSSRYYPVEFRKLWRRLGILAVFVSAFGWVVSQLIVRHAGPLLTKDLRVLSAMNGSVVWLAAALLLHPFNNVLEGTIIASRQFTLLVQTYIVTVLIHLSSLKYVCREFGLVWVDLVLGFQSVRLVCFAIGSLNHHSKNKKSHMGDAILPKPQNFTWTEPII